MPTLDETDDKDGDDEVHSREEDYFISMPASEFMNQVCFHEFQPLHSLRFSFLIKCL